MPPTVTKVMSHLKQAQTFLYNRDVGTKESLCCNEDFVVTRVDLQ